MTTMRWFYEHPIATTILILVASVCFTATWAIPLAKSQGMLP